MKNWKDTLVSPEDSIRAVLEKINALALQIAVVVNGDRKLLGTVTDGDVRRGILRGVSLDSPVQEIMNSEPRFLKKTRSKSAALDLMNKLQIRHVPIVDNDGILLGVEFLHDLLQPSTNESWVVLMAGGLGQRMSPLTDKCPKPMLKVGDKPVLEIILNQFIREGFRKFYISVNYMADVIESHFGDGSRWDVEIRYLREDKRLGTAGALSLLPVLPSDPVIVMNGDLLTKLSMGRLLEFHREQQSKLTMCVREYDFQVPYGVAKIEENRLVGIDEKPVHKFFVNAGIYVLSPEVIGMIPRDQEFDMPTLLDQLIQKGEKLSPFPIQEYWLDIGRHSDFQRAQDDFSEFDS